jgi:hypothetical protein
MTLTTAQGGPDALDPSYLVAPFPSSYYAHLHAPTLVFDPVIDHHKDLPTGRIHGQQHDMIKVGSGQDWISTLYVRAT